MIFAILLAPASAFSGYRAYYCVELPDGPPVTEIWFGVFTAISIAQLVLAGFAIVRSRRAWKADASVGRLGHWLGGIVAAGAALGWTYEMGLMVLKEMTTGGGRALRIRGMPVRAQLAPGNAWCRGPRPDTATLDSNTRTALEALWLRDAQHEHASIPAFARISWTLAALGAPPELLTLSHLAAIDEIEHAQGCFAAAAAYRGAPHTVMPMPSLSGIAQDSAEDVATLASETLLDGCLVEGFNADVATEALCHAADPAIRALLQKIANDEQRHAEFSWRVLDWLIAEHPQESTTHLERVALVLVDVIRPRAVSDDHVSLLKHANADALVAHGRLPDAAWENLWLTRTEKTRLRLRRMLNRSLEHSASTN